MKAFRSFLVTGGALAAIATTGCETSKPGPATPDSGTPNESGGPVADGASPGAEGGDATGDEIADASDAADMGAADIGVTATIPTLHRATSSSCVQPRPPGQPGPLGPGCGGYFVDAGSSGCTTDQDCKSGQNGRCDCTHIGSTTYTENACSYDTCMSDSDCNGTVCNCREDPTNFGTQTFCFTSGNCLIDSDCGPAAYCSPSPNPGWGAGSWYGYFCHTAGDECINDRDCPQGVVSSGIISNAYCAYDQARARWMCATGRMTDS